MHQPKVLPTQVLMLSTNSNSNSGPLMPRPLRSRLCSTATPTLIGKSVIVDAQTRARTNRPARRAGFPCACARCDARGSYAEEVLVGLCSAALSRLLSCR